MTDLVNVTKYHNKGYKGQGVKCVIIDSDWGGWSKLKDEGIVKNGHAWRSIEYGTALVEDRSSPGHGVSMVRAFHEMAPEAEIYLYENTFLQVDDGNVVLNYFRTEGISLVSHSLNTVNCSNSYTSFLTGEDALTLHLDFLGSSLTVCVIAGNYANNTSFFHLVKDSSSNNMLFPNGTQDLYIQVVNLPLNIEITRSGYQRIVNYQYVLTNQRTGIEIENGRNQPVYKDIAVAVGQAIVGDTLRLNIVRNIDIVNDLNIIIGDFSGNFFKLQNPAEMNSESSIALPGASKKAITTGAILVSNYHKRDVISSMSGRGPIPADVDGAGRVVVPYTFKPELCAPSEGGATSPTAPRVAGALAVLASAGLCDLSKPEEAKQYLLDNHVIKILPFPNNTFGYGRLFLDAKTDSPTPTPPVPDPLLEEDAVMMYPNPVSLSNSNGLRIANIPLTVTELDARIYNITGELVKSFSILELVDDMNKKMIKWDLKNQNGDKVAPGVYFITIKTNFIKNQIKKIAVKK
ncbi:MAG: S8 family peptidase [Endomicrobium sp.]|nr:S8 family peptidase [Endomicrobium sp.]